MGMIEAQLEKLNFPDAPKMITEFPGPLARKTQESLMRTESMARGGGQWPLIFDKGFGVTIKSPDGNLYIDLSAGVGVNSVGRCHPQVVKAICDQAQNLMHASAVSNSKCTDGQLLAVFCLLQLAEIDPKRSTH